MRDRDAEQFWPSRRGLFVVAAAAFVVSAILAAPASLWAPLIAAPGAPVAYERIDGTIWRGEIKNLSVGEQYYGKASFRLAPVKLLLGRLEAALAAEGGDVVGHGRVSVGVFDQSVSIADAVIDFELASVRRYTMFGLPYQGDVRANIDRLAWGRNGCRTAEGEIWTDMLDAPSKQWLGEGIVMVGGIACAENDLALMFEGANSQGETKITVTILPDLTYQFVAAVEPKEAALTEGLELVGFENDGERLVYDAYGALKGLKS